MQTIRTRISHLRYMRKLWSLKPTLRKIRKKSNPAKRHIFRQLRLDPPKYVNPLSSDRLSLFRFKRRDAQGKGLELSNALQNDWWSHWLSRCWHSADYETRSEVVLGSGLCVERTVKNEKLMRRGRNAGTETDCLKWRRNSYLER